MLYQSYVFSPDVYLLLSFIYCGFTLKLTGKSARTIEAYSGKSALTIYVYGRKSKKVEADAEKFEREVDNVGSTLIEKKTSKPIQNVVRKSEKFINRTVLQYWKWMELKVAQLNSDEYDEQD